MNRLNIDGSEKTTDSYCESCQNGKIFEGNYMKTQRYQDNDKSFICESCLSKFKIKRKKADRLIDENCVALCPYVGKTKCENTDDFLCFGNKKKFITEVEKMISELDLIEDRETFKETGKCENHHWITTNPVKTPEGKFVFETCLVCKEGKLNYKGSLYEGKLTTLVDFLVKKGIEYEKTAHKIEKEFEQTDAGPCDISLDELFNDTPKPSLEEIFQ